MSSICIKYIPIPMPPMPPISGIAGAAGALSSSLANSVTIHSVVIINPAIDAAF